MTWRAHVFSVVFPKVAWVVGGLVIQSRVQNARAGEGSEDFANERRKWDSPMEKQLGKTCLRLVTCNEGQHNSLNLTASLPLDS